MKNKVTIVWFRQDLRISDNPALYEAAGQGTVLPVYILDEKHSGDFQTGLGSRWWLHQSLEKLHESLDGRLLFFKGDSKSILLKLVRDVKATGVFWNRCYEPWAIQRDSNIKQHLIDVGIDARSFNGSLLWEPHEIVKSDGTFYKVFTPYKNACLKITSPRECLNQIKNITFVQYSKAFDLDSLQLLTHNSVISRFEKYWIPGEKQAHKMLDIFIKQKLAEYQEGRDFPALQTTSRLSPYLHFGEISPNQVWWTIKDHGFDFASRQNVEYFLRELMWREFSYYILFYVPTITHKNVQSKFDGFVWNHDQKKVDAWTMGMTGYPIVDAGMRELWHTGFMHNRVRMIVASFLIKNIMIDWRQGHLWFWQLLVDADLASNSFNWQWVAGCGYDAAPYFRIFNPILQTQKFDRKGDYIRQWIPELQQLPDKYLKAPWMAPDHVLTNAKIVLGKTYPKPIVDLAKSRQQALKYFKMLK